ncbi:MAG TPA: hypothetical protein G4N98_00970 [Thermoflexia bacterium]|nr:hypothetical protein [Thermoflexia bacterium]
MNNSIFTLSGVTLPQQTDPLGLWAVAPPAAHSFAARDCVSQEPTWRVVLPPDPDAALAALAAQAERLACERRALARAQITLAELGAAGQPSFAVGAPLAAPQTALWEQVEELRAPQSYGLLDWRKNEERQTLSRRWSDFLEQLRRLVTNYARIETASGAQEIGLTRVSWTGDFTTTWLAGEAVCTRQQHIQAVQLALESRLTLLHLVAVVAGGAAGLAAKAAVPGGELLLLPAIWRFVKEVLQELR